LIIYRDGRICIDADALMIENKVMPIFYLNLYRLMIKSLAATGLKLADIDHFIYSNISQRDRDGFRRMCSLAPESLPVTRMVELGHSFASDLTINYTQLQSEGRIKPGELLLFASAGVGFTWGVTLARA
jgi:3-oxoacyl-[acyl-carrier-protein] synthase-3